MSERGKFLIYVVERYKSTHGLTGKEVAEIFDKYQVWEYVYDTADALHTTGENYILYDIETYIQEQK